MDAENDSPRLLDCGLCYEEDGQEVHPHPECKITNIPGPRREVLAAGLKWLFETEQPEGAMVSHHGEHLYALGNRTYQFVPRGFDSGRSPVVIVDVTFKKWDKSDPYHWRLTNGLEVGEMEAVAADLAALGVGVVKTWNGRAGGETGSLALEGRAHPALLAAVALEKAGCPQEGSEHRHGSVFCGCGWRKPGRALAVGPVYPPED